MQRLIFYFLLIVVAWGCKPRNRQPDLEKRIQTTIQAKSNYEDVTSSVYVCEEADVYKDRRLKTIAARLHIGNTLKILFSESEYENFLDPEYVYQVQYYLNNKKYRGYIKGNVLAFGGHIGAKDLVLACRYLEYNNPTVHNESMHKGEVLFMNNNRIVTRLPFYGNNDVSIQHFIHTGLPDTIKCFRLFYGIGIFGWKDGEVIFYNMNDKLYALCTNTYIMHPGVEDLNCEYVFPADGGKPAEIRTILHHKLWKGGKELDEKTEENTYRLRNGRFVKI